MNALLPEDTMPLRADPGTFYNAQLTAGALLLPESRQIARLLLAGVDEAGWRKAIYEDNVLQKRSRLSVKRMAGLIRSRLLLVKQEQWKTIAEGDRDTASQALLVASIKHSRLLGDFMQTVYKDAARTLRQSISRQDWDSFLKACEQRCPEMTSWTSRTRRDLGNTVLRILAESGYLENTKTLRLTPMTIVPEVRRYLEDNGEAYVLACMDMTR